MFDNIYSEIFYLQNLIFDIKDEKIFENCFAIWEQILDSVEKIRDFYLDGQLRLF